MVDSNLIQKMWKYTKLLDNFTCLFTKVHEKKSLQL